jgi:hypothetical protein
MNEARTENQRSTSTLLREQLNIAGYDNSIVLTLQDVRDILDEIERLQRELHVALNIIEAERSAHETEKSDG